MSIFIPGDLAVGNARAVSRSALPDAPVVSDGAEPRPVRRVTARRRLGAALRAVARHELRLAERIDPAPSC